MLEKILAQVASNMDKTLEQFKAAMNKIRAGRADSALVEDILIDHYGVKTPLKQLATISTPQANLIQVMPWDKGLLKPIENALSQADLGAQPVNDGSLIRLVLPPMTGERRLQVLDLLKKQVEEGRVVIRQAREEGWKKIQAEVRSGGLTEDDKYRAKDKLDQLVRKFNEQIEALAEAKRQEIAPNNHSPES